MKSQHLMLVGVILMLIGFITPRVAPSVAVSLGIILTLGYVAGLLMLIVGAFRRSHEKKKKD
jgi:F0F1-type ATP synthase assembly protein I